MILSRPRVTGRLAAAATFPVTLLSAPAGYGKSVALDAYLADLPGEIVRFNVRRSHASLARFVRAFAAALEPTLPRIGQSLAIACERARQSPNASDVLATWLAEHLDGDRTVVIDDLHHCEGERAIANLLASTIERTRRSVRWILATRSTADLPYATWFSRGDAALPVNENVLRASPAEALALGALLWPGADPETVSRLAGLSGGAPGVLAFALSTLAQDPAAAPRLLDSAGDVFATFGDEVLLRFTPGQRRLLIEAAAFPEIDEALIERPGKDAAAFAAIAEAAPQIFERRDGRRHFHASFAALLLDRLRDLGPATVRSASLGAARALERSGRIAEALASHIRDRRDAELVRVIEAHGFTYLEAGYGESIHDAIDALDPLVQTTSPSVLAIKAMSESTIGRFDTAESWFQLALDRAQSPLRPQIAYQYGSHLLRFFRTEAARVFEEIGEDPAVPVKLRAYALSALGPAYVFEHRLADARAASVAALHLASDVAMPHVLAKIHHQAAFVALHAGDARAAKDLATASLALATEHGFYDVAAGALSVLYNVASDIEDDPAETLRLLEAMGDCAAKSGSLVNQLISLAAMLEIEIEAGNEDAATRLEAKLRTLDVTFAGRTTYEALLPSRALRASWSGDFVGAYRLLSGSAVQQWSPDRRALRHAEIAAYAAAAGLRDEAVAAFDAASDVLDGIVVDLRVQRSRLVLAFAAIVLGWTERAASLLEDVDASPNALSRRLRALRRTIRALHERYRGERNQDEVLGSLAGLSTCGLAGFGRAVAMLPLSDNAMHRAAHLSASERRAVLELADGTSEPSDDHVAAIVHKLGCANRGALIRAVTWHRAAFERPGAETVRNGGVPEC